MDKARVFGLTKEQGHICTCEKLELCPWKNESLRMGFLGLSLLGDVVTFSYMVFQGKCCGQGTKRCWLLVCVQGGKGVLLQKSHLVWRREGGPEGQSDNLGSPGSCVALEAP